MQLAVLGCARHYPTALHPILLGVLHPVFSGLSPVSFQSSLNTNAQRGVLAPMGRVGQPWPLHSYCLNFEKVSPALEY